MSPEAKNFLQKYQSGPKNKSIYEAWENGFLRIQYDCDGEMDEVSFVSKKGQKPNNDQLRLYFMMNNNMVTCKSEMSLSGTYWSDGYSGWGTVFDDDSDGGPDNKCELEDWIAKCLKQMCSSD